MTFQQELESRTSQDPCVKNTSPEVVKNPNTQMVQ